MAPHVSDFIQLLVAQAGDAYRFGVEVDLNDPDPDAFDCSELVEWAAHRVGVTPKVPDGSWIQARHCQQHGTLIPISEAVDTPGALLFRFSSSPFTGTRPTSSHVAVSLGDGRTIEARNTASGTGIFNATGRSWTHAGLVPFLNYDAKPKPPSRWARPSWDKALAVGVVNPESNPHDQATLEQVVVLLNRGGLLDD